MPGKSILYIVSLVDKSLPLYWYFRELKKTGTTFTILFLHPTKPELQHQLEAEGIPCYYINYGSKFGIPSALLKTYSLIRKLRPSLVHTHLFDASLIGLTAAYWAGVKRRVHTRHHASHHHIYYPHAVKYDRYINRLSDSIFAVSQSIADILVHQEGVSPDKVHILNHGFDLDAFTNIPKERIMDVRHRHGIPEGKTYVGVISRYTHWKGIQYIIPAFQSLLLDYPNLHLVLANAQGDFSHEIKEIISALPSGSYTEIGFESDGPALMAGFDYFIHVPIDAHAEAFGQVYVEALAAGVPSVFTLSGIAHSFIRHGVNALVADYQSSDSIRLTLTPLIQQPDLGKRLAEKGKSDVKNNFDIQLMVQNSLTYYEL